MNIQIKTSRSEAVEVVNKLGAIQIINRTPQNQSLIVLSVRDAMAMVAALEQVIQCAGGK